MKTATTLVLALLVASVARGDAGEAAAEWIETRRASAEIPGVIAAVVRGDEVLMARGFGTADSKANRPVDADTLFRVGSVSKPVTATGALVAMERFGISPHDDLGALFQALPISPPLDAPLSFHHLLTHTGGFSESLAGQHVVDPANFQSLEDYLMARLPPRFERPGVVITYNDHHTALAGYAIEKLARRSFHQFMADAVFAPIGMSRSTFDQLEIASHPDLSNSWRLDDDRLVPYPRDLILAPPGAGLATTANDMATWLRHLLSESSPHPEQLSIQFRNHPLLRGRAYGFAESHHEDALVLYKDGQANGFGARLLIEPAGRLAVFVAVNRSILGTMGRSNEAASFMRQFTSEMLSMIPHEHPARPVLAAEGQAPSMPSEVYGYYRTTAAARHSWEKLIAMLDSAAVEDLSNDGIRVGDNAYVSSGDGLYRLADGDFHVGFIEGSSGTYLVIGGGSYERVSMFGVQTGTIAVVAILLVAALISLGLALVRRWPKFVRVGLVAGSAGRLIFFGLVAATLVFMDPQRLFYGMPPLLAIACGIALVSVVADFTAVAGGVQSATRWVRAWLAAYIATTVLFVCWLYYWNLLGWQTGNVS